MQSKGFDIDEFYREMARMRQEYKDRLKVETVLSDPGKDESSKRFDTDEFYREMARMRQQHKDRLKEETVLSDPGKDESSKRFDTDGFYREMARMRQEYRDRLKGKTDNAVSDDKTGTAAVVAVVSDDTGKDKTGTAAVVAVVSDDTGKDKTGTAAVVAVVSDDTDKDKLIASLRAEIAERDKKIESLQKRNLEKAGQLKTLQASMQDQEEAFEQAEQEFNNNIALMKDEIMKLGLLNEKLAADRLNFGTLEEELREKTAEVQTLQAELKAAKSSGTAPVVPAAGDSATMAAKIAELEAELEESNEKNLQLETDEALLKQSLRSLEQDLFAHKKCIHEIDNAVKKIPFSFSNTKSTMQEVLKTYDKVVESCIPKSATGDAKPEPSVPATGSKPGAKGKGKGHS